MGVLREKMIAEMNLRNFASRTPQSYVATMVGLAIHYRRFPDQLTQDEIRGYLLHLQERGLSSTRKSLSVLHRPCLITSVATPTAWLYPMTVFFKSKTEKSS